MRAHLVVVPLLALAATAHAESRATIRVGMLPLQLEASGDTPLFGDQMQEAMDNYGVDSSELGISEDLYSIAPGFEVGAGRYLFRLEGVLGTADDLTAIGVGIYPIGVQGKLGRRVTAYASAGGIATWLDRAGDGDVGGLVSARLALGARIADRFLVEAGYNAFVLGGSVNQSRLEGMRNGTEMPTSIDKVVSGGEASGLVDVSVGLSF